MDDKSADSAFSVFGGILIKTKLEDEALDPTCKEVVDQNGDRDEIASREADFRALMKQTWNCLPEWFTELVESLICPAKLA